MDSVPGATGVVVKVATPPANAWTPKIALPLLNVTAPVAVPGAEKTVAVNVTGCPTVEGFAEVARVTVVGALELLPRLAETAVMVAAKFAANKIAPNVTILREMRAMLIRFLCCRCITHKRTVAIPFNIRHLIVIHVQAE